MAFTFILDLWRKWNIRGFIVLSLLLQVFLILFAPLRKKTTDRRIIFLLWLAYLMADSVAAFAVGLISHNQGNSSAHVAEVDEGLQAFWSSFLLLHLGGPDTITAFSLEDSSLWPRHLLSFIFQVYTAIYVFLRIFPNNKSLVIPTILVFLAGVIKIAERTLALYLSSLPRIRESMLLDKELRMAADSQLLEELNVLGDEHGSFDEESTKLDESIVPNVMSDVATVGIAQKKSADTLRELRHLIISDETKDLERICKKLYNRVGHRAGAVLGGINHSESLLDKGLLMALRVEDLGKMKWNYLSRQWFGMLQYAAVNIKGEAHVQVLSKGGELLAFVWLLMAHFGCFYKPE